MKRNRTELYLESASDYSITKIVGKRSDTITPEVARELWETGKVDDYNVAFKRLVDNGFDVEAVKAYYNSQRRIERDDHMLKA